MALDAKELKIGFGIVAFLLVIAFITPNNKTLPTEATERSAASLERLNSIVQEQTGYNLYERYEIEANGNSVTIYLNPNLWNRLPPGEQRQLCDLLAGGKFMSEMSLSSALLYVGRTLVGGIGRRGDSQWFSPELDSLK